MSELKLGKMTRAELAEWFGIKTSTYDHTKKQRLAELKEFADYEVIYGGVNILEIKIPEYVKSGSKAYNIVKNNFYNVWHNSGYDTASRAGSQLWHENKELKNLISERTAKMYMAKVRTELYGRVHKNEHGTVGTCKLAYVVTNEWEEAILLSREQNMQVHELIQKIYTNEQEPLMYEAYKEGTITEEELEEFRADWNNRAEMRYWEFITQVEQILGFIPVKVTRIRDDEELSAF